VEKEACGVIVPANGSSFLVLFLASKWALQAHLRMTFPLPVTRNRLDEACNA